MIFVKWRYQFFVENCKEIKKWLSFGIISVFTTVIRPMGEFFFSTVWLKLLF